MNCKESFRILMQNFSLFTCLSLVCNFLRRPSSFEELLNFLSIFLELNCFYQVVSKPSFVTMIETRSLSALIDKVNALSKTTELHQAEMHEIHQKLDAVTSVLQTLSETMQNFIEAGHRWQQRLSFPGGSKSVLTVIPKAVRLELHKFKGENPLRWVFKFHQFFQLYNTLPNQKEVFRLHGMPTSIVSDWDAVFTLPPVDADGLFNPEPFAILQTQSK